MQLWPQSMELQFPLLWVLTYLWSQLEEALHDPFTLCFLDGGKREEEGGDKEGRGGRG